MNVVSVALISKSGNVWEEVLARMGYRVIMSLVVEIVLKTE